MNTLRDLVEDHPPLVLSEDVTVLQAVRFLTEKRIGAVPVLAGDRLVGVFSERDLMTRVVVPGLDPGQVRLRDVMTRNLVVAESSDTIARAIQKMHAAHCRHLPVIENDKLKSFISLRDVLEADRNEKAHEIEWMTEYIQYIPPHRK